MFAFQSNKLLITLLKAIVYKIFRSILSLLLRFIISLKIILLIYKILN